LGGFFTDHDGAWHQSLVVLDQQFNLGHHVGAQGWAALANELAGEPRFHDAVLDVLADAVPVLCHARLTAGIELPGAVHHQEVDVFGRVHHLVVIHISCSISPGDIGLVKWLCTSPMCMAFAGVWLAVVAVALAWINCLPSPPAGTLLWCCWR